MGLHAKTHCSVVGMKCNDCITSTDTLVRYNLQVINRALYVKFSFLLNYIVVEVTNASLLPKLAVEIMFL